MPFCGFSILTSKLVRQVALLKPVGQNIVGHEYILGAFKMRGVQVQVAVFTLTFVQLLNVKIKKLLWWVALERGTAKEEAV